MSGHHIGKGQTDLIVSSLLVSLNVRLHREVRMACVPIWKGKRAFQDTQVIGSSSLL